MPANFGGQECKNQNDISKFKIETLRRFDSAHFDKLSTGTAGLAQGSCLIKEAPLGIRHESPRGLRSAGGYPSTRPFGTCSGFVPHQRSTSPYKARTCAFGPIFWLFSGSARYVSRCEEGIKKNLRNYDFGSALYARLAQTRV